MEEKRASLMRYQHQPTKEMLQTLKSARINMHKTVRFSRNDYGLELCDDIQLLFGTGKICGIY